MMKRLLLATAALIVAASAPARAQMAVISPSADMLANLGLANQAKDIAQGLRQLNELQAQLAQARALYEATNNVRDLGSAVNALGAAGIRNPLPINPYAAQSLLNGTGGMTGISSNLGSLFTGSLSANRVYAPDGSTWQGAELNRTSGGLAGAQAMVMELYRAAADRVAHLDVLRGQIASATDQGTRDALTAQFAAEQAAIGNQTVQVQAINGYVAAQQASNGVRLQERRQMEIDEVLAQARAHGINTGNIGQ